MEIEREAAVNNTMPKRENLFKKLIQQPEIGVLIPLILLIIGTALGSESFLTAQNFSSILRLLIQTAFCALGVTFTIICGDIDISIGQLGALGAMVFSSLVINNNWNPLLALLIALLIGVAAGIIKGIIVAKLGMSAFMATIGFLFVFKGIKFLITNGYPVYPFPASVKAFGDATPMGLSWSVIIAIVCYIIFEIFLRRTPFGRKMYAVGDNSAVAKLAGINVLLVRTVAYIMCSLAAVVGGILTAIQIGLGEPTMGEGWEMYAIAAAAVGGIAMHGGKGSLLGTFIGVLFIAVLNNSMVMLGVNSNVQTTLTGLLLIGAVLIDIWKSSRKKAA